MVPPINRSIFIDIETNVYDNKIWMIGAKIGDEYFQFTAMRWEDEVKVLNQFSDLLGQYPGFPLICYSRTNFDFRYIWHAAKRHNLPLEDSMKHRAWIDLATLLNRSYVSPVKSLALKKLGILIGYEFSHEGLDGFELSVRYETLVRKHGQIPEDFLQKAEEYNRDDLDLMVRLLEKSSEYVVQNEEYVRQMDTRSLIRQIRQGISDFNQTTNRIRVSVALENRDKMVCMLQQIGAPLPMISDGKHTSRLVWSSKLGYERLQSIVDQLGG